VERFYLNPFGRAPPREAVPGRQTATAPSAAAPSPLSQPAKLAVTPDTPPAETPSPAPSSPDETAWRTAVAANTIAGFNDYLQVSPAGGHAEEARLQIADLILSSPVRSKAYDGRWSTIISCPAFGRAQGYSQELSAEVKDGAYHAHLGTVGEPGSLVIDGKVISDGASALLAKGSVGSTAASGGSPVGTTYFFHVLAQFEQSRGSGKRVEFRPCNLTFVKQ
jgi:hypothetical protein